MPVEDDLACRSLYDDARDRGRTGSNGDRQTVRAEPGGEAIHVAVELQPGYLDGTGPMGYRGATGKRRPPPPTS